MMLHQFFNIRVWLSTTDWDSTSHFGDVAGKVDNPHQAFLILYFV